MGTTAIYYPHAIIPPDGVLPITQLADITSQYNFTDFIEFAAGQFAPGFAAATQSSPDLPFRTRQIRSVLQMMIHATRGHTVAYDASSGPTQVYYKKGQSHGFRVDDAQVEHERLTLTQTGWLWDQISASQSAAAELQGRIIPTQLADKSAPPAIFQKVALAGTSGIDSTFTLGPMKINNAWVESLQSVAWTNSINPAVIADGGDEFPNYANFGTYSPTLTFTNRDARLMRTWTNRGIEITSLVWYLRQIKEHDILWGPTENKHIRFTATKARGAPRRLTGAAGTFDGFIQMVQPTPGAHPFTIQIDQPIV